MSTYREYCDYLFSDEGMCAESGSLTDAVTTNKTDFFREPDHFEALAANILPELAAEGIGPEKELRVWSAGCSTGEEPYTIAIVLSEYARNGPKYFFSVTGTDISQRVLTQADEGIYEAEKIDLIPMELKKRYFLRSKDEDKNLVKLTSGVREKVSFSKLNLVGRNFGIMGPFSVIFCRNVIIYFDKETQEKLLRRLCRYLAPGGYLIVGHSETLSSLNVPLSYAAPTIYRKI